MTGFHSYQQRSMQLLCFTVQVLALLKEGGTSLEKLLPLIHPLDDHLAVHVAHLNRVNARAWLQEH